MKVMIVVTHLLGTGHLTRALTLARAFAAAGDQVVLLSGGVPVGHLDFDGIALVQLPPLKSALAPLACAFVNDEVASSNGPASVSLLGQFASTSTFAA